MKKSISEKSPLFFVQILQSGVLHLNDISALIQGVKINLKVVLKDYASSALKENLLLHLRLSFSQESFKDSVNLSSET